MDHDPPSPSSPGLSAPAIAPGRAAGWAQIVCWAMLAVASLFCGGCGPSEAERLAAIYAAAATNPSAAQSQLVASWTARRITLDRALDLGHARLDAGDPGAPAFALALLGAIAELEGPITRANVNEFFWIRTGTLAGSAGAVALKMGDVTGARTVVLAGPRRWQTEAYWRMHPDHDALASWIMHKAGESGPALARLRERGEPDEQLLATSQRIQSEQRAAEAARGKAAGGGGR